VIIILVSLNIQKHTTSKIITSTYGSGHIKQQQFITSFHRCQTRSAAACLSVCAACTADGIIRAAAVVADTPLLSLLYSTKLQVKNEIFEEQRTTETVD